MARAFHHGGLLLAGMLGLSFGVWAQSSPSAGLPAAQGAAAGATRLIGTVTASSADSLTLKLASGGEATVQVGPQTRMVRTAPGQTTLAGATVIHLDDLTTGDRVLVRALPGADATHYTASVVIAMKQADIAQVHASQAADWQKRGVSGIVTSVDTSAGAGSATITVGTAQPGKTILVEVAPGTLLRRYASDSVNFADIKPSTLADIHPGDQLRARGDRSADRSSLSAVEIVTGSFRNLSGTITAIDPAENTLTLTDLATKKPVTLKLTADTQMRKLPPEMAQRLAGRREGGSGPRTAGPGNPTANTAAGASADRQPPPAAGASQPAGPSPAASGEAAGPRNDPSAMLQRAPTVTLAELHQGEAVMVVATQAGDSAANGATAITLIAGVEPLLEKSSGAASQNLFSASWNLGGGGGEAQQ